MFLVVLMLVIINNYILNTQTDILNKKMYLMCSEYDCLHYLLEGAVSVGGLAHQVSWITG